MIDAPDGNLHVYMLSVGQADTSVIISPKGTVIIIDARRPAKILRLLDDLGLDDETVEHLIITHPHDDHFSGGNSLAANLTIEQATLAPFWHEFGLGPTTYRRLVGRLEDQGTNVTFLSGYGRWYLDNALMDDPAGGDPVVDPNAPYLELLGPTNGLVRLLEEANVFNANHLTIMTRLAWRNFRMISTGDAQMENWAFFDQERLMEGPCHVLRAAHHGSMNGTQWERIDRLDPDEVIVSSDPDGRHNLPDLIGTAILAKFDSTDNRMAVITRDAGSIHLTVTGGGDRSFERFGDDPAGDVNLGGAAVLDSLTNPTDWARLLDDRVANP